MFADRDFSFFQNWKAAGLIPEPLRRPQRSNMLMKYEPAFASRTQAETQKEFWAVEEFVFGKGNERKLPNINTETHRKKPHDKNSHRDSLEVCKTFPCR